MWPKHCLPGLWPRLLLIAVALTACGTRSVAQVTEKWLEPPPAAEPQPKFACAEPKVRRDPVWWGQTVTFTWQVTNEGGAPLRMQVDA